MLKDIKVSMVVPGAGEYNILKAHTVFPQNPRQTELISF